MKELIEIIKDSGVFLQFHVKKGLEFSDDNLPLGSIRSTSVNNMEKLNRPLLLTIEGQEGAMLLTPKIINDLLVNSVYISKRNSNEILYIVSKFYWRPLGQFELQELYSYWKIVKEYSDRFTSILNTKYGSKN